MVDALLVEALLDVLVEVSLDDEEDDAEELDDGAVDDLEGLSVL